MIVLVGYVNTPAGHAALDAGIAQVHKDGGRLIVVNGSRSVQRNDSYHLGEADLRSVEDDLAQAGIDHRVLTLEGDYDPAEQILDTAGEVGAELIVLGTRKRTPVGKYLLGSTIQKVIIDANCPVLSVKAAD